jgi:hypothetical protein
LSVTREGATSGGDSDEERGSDAKDTSRTVDDCPA